MMPGIPRPHPTLGWPMAGAMLLLAAAVWSRLLPIVAVDLVWFNIPWYRHAVDTGSLAVFRQPWSNYTPPYLYGLVALVPLHDLLGPLAAVKLLSALGTLALAGAVWRLMRALGVADAGPLACCVVALPSIALNAAALGQCDALATAPLVMALAGAVERRHRAMLGWCGLALAIKLQAILFAPFVIGLVVARRVPLRDLPAMPLALAAAFAPAWALGWPLADLATIYLRQSEHFAELSRNAPNIWMIVQSIGLGSPVLTGLAVAAAVGASATLMARMSADAARLTPVVLLRFALLAPLLTAGLLPRMHERYFFIADVVAFALAAVVRDRRSVAIAALVQAGSTLALIGYTSGAGDLAAAGGLAMIAATAMVVRDLWPPAANDNPLPLRPLPA